MIELVLGLLVSGLFILMMYFAVLLQENSLKQIRAIIREELDRRDEDE